MHFTIWSGSTRPKFYVFRTNHDQSYLPPRLTWYKIRLAKSHRNLPHFRCLSLDLPFHGENKAVAVEDFEQTAQFLESQIKSLIKDEPYILIGYSLGGRIAQYYALQARVKIGHLKAIILEGANLGLQSEQENKAV